MLQRYTGFSILHLISLSACSMSSSKAHLPVKSKPLPAIKPKSGNKPTNHDLVMAKREKDAARQRKYAITRLPPTKNAEEIFQYYNRYASRFTLSQYLIVFSRLAHIKKRSVNTAHPAIQRMINGLCGYKLHEFPYILSNFIKYTSMIGIKDRTLWTKFIRSIRNTRNIAKPMEIALYVSHIAKSGIKGDDLWRDLQTEIERTMDEHLTGYEFTELILKGLLGRKLEPGFEKKMISKIKEQISFVNLYSLKSLIFYCYRFEFRDPELWRYFQKWTLYRLERSKDDFMYQDQFPFMIQYLGEASIKGLLSQGDLKNDEKFYDQIYKFFCAAREKLGREPDQAIQAYYGLIAGYSACGVVNEGIRKDFEEYFQAEKGKLGPKDYELLIKLLTREYASEYFSDEVIQVIQNYIIENLPRFTIEQYNLVLNTVERVRQFDKDRLYPVIIKSLDYFIHINDRHVLVPKILDTVESRNLLPVEAVQEKRIFYNLQ